MEGHGEAADGGGEGAVGARAEVDGDGADCEASTTVAWRDGVCGGGESEGERGWRWRWRGGGDGGGGDGGGGDGGGGDGGGGEGGRGDGGWWG